MDALMAFTTQCTNGGDKHLKRNTTSAVVVPKKSDSHSSLAIMQINQLFFALSAEISAMDVNHIDMYSEHKATCKADMPLEGLQQTGLGAGG